MSLLDIRITNEYWDMKKRVRENNKESMKKYIEKVIRVRKVNPSWIRSRRLKNGLTLREVSRRLGFSVAFLSDVELGRRNASQKIIEFFENL